MIERQAEKEKLKYCFDICVRKKFENKEIKTLAQKINTSTTRIKSNAKKYYDNFATEEEKKEYDALYNQKNKQDKKIETEEIMLFEKILNSSCKEEYINEYKNSKLSTNRLKQKVNKYLKKLKTETNITKEEIEKIRQILNITILEYEKFLKEEKETKEQEQEKEKDKLLPKAETFVAMIIDSDNLSYEQISNKYNITKEELKYYIEIVKEKNQPLYEEYINKIREIKTKKYHQAIEKLKEICKILKKDIENNNEKRFNILDYYIITKIDLSEMLKIAKNECTQEEYYLFKMFCEDNNNLNKINIKAIMEIEEDKERTENIISYMKENKLPMIEEIYNLLKEEKTSIKRNK